MGDGAGGGGADATRGRAVLVVDDDRDVRELVRLMLRRGGHEVIEASDGDEAVRVVGERAGDIGAVLLDVMMPRMTGHEALPAIRDLVPDMPVVFFTGYDRGEVAAHLDEAPAHTDFLAKPFDRETLLETMEAALNASRGPRANGRH